MSQIPKSCEKTRDFFKKYFHLNSPAVYNSSAKKEAFYFIDRETTVDNRDHWEELQCGVITDVIMETTGRKAKRKVTPPTKQNKIESSSSSSDEHSRSEMFPSNDEGNEVDAAANEAAKIFFNNKAFDLELDMQYRKK